MQKNQNAEIQQRVINLVDLYRTKVGKESQIAKDAKEEHDYWQQVAIDMMEDEDFFGGGLDGEGPHTEVWIKHLRVNEQLLGHFYAEVSGANADKKILSGLLPEIYDKTIFTEEEELFLKSHFKEMVNFIIKSPSNDEYLKWVNRSDGRDGFIIPDEVMDLIASRANIAEGSKIYYPKTGYAQLINQFEGCKFYCDDTNAWMQLAILANNADVEILEDGAFPSSYDFVVSYPYGVLDEDAPYDMGKEDKCTKTLISAYDHLNDGGRMILLCPNKLLCSKYPHDLNFFTKDDKGKMNKVLNPIRDIHYEFRHRLIDDGSIVEIIQLPQVMSSNAITRDYSLLIVEKGRTEGVLSMIDARYAFKKTKKTNFSKILDLNAFNAMLKNHGCDTETGLRKMVDVSISDLDEQMMIPQVYVIERPSENEHPVPLSSLCQLVTERVRDVKFDLPIDTPWVKNKDLSVTYRGVLEIDTLDKANCPNNPRDKSVIDLDDVNNWLVDTTPDDLRIAQYRVCTYLDGNRDAVLISFENERVATALYRATGKPIVVDGDSWRHVHVLYPNKDVDALSLLSILRMPVVYRQILAYKEFGLYGKYGHLNDILVPSDKRIIHDEVQRMDNEQESYKRQEELLAAKKTEYINEVRMRKHDMGQYIFELVNIEDLMRYYVENRDKKQNFCQELETLLDNFRTSLGELSTLLDNLSKEEQFGDPEAFNMTEFLSGLEKRHTKDSYRIQYTCDLPSIKKYNKKKQQAELDAINDQMMDVDMKRQAELDAIADQMMEVDMKRQAELDAIADQMMEEDMKRQAELDAIADQMMREDMKQQAELDAINDQMMEVDMKRQAELDAINDQMMEEDMKQQGVEGPLTMSSIVGNENEIVSKANMYVPPIFVDPNDFQRLVNNILNNAKKHGFTNPDKKDYVIQINASIDVESSMYRIDFRNNGNPLPEGMNKMRYGIKGEKAGKTAGTGLGGNYVKSFVEHYGGDYDIFMEDGWTVVRIYLPIK